MKANEQTLQEVERAIRKVADKFPQTDEASILTDIHLRVNQETGELVAFDDDDKYQQQIESMSILKPYSFVLEDEDHENLEELYVVDDDTVIIDEELMKGLDKDLTDFMNKLFAE